MMADKRTGLGRYCLERVTGDGNRTRTISLGIRPIGCSDRPDLGIRHTASDRGGRCDTGVNGPPMAHGYVAVQGSYPQPAMLL